MSWPSMGNMPGGGELPGKDDPPLIVALKIRSSFQECRAEGNVLSGFLKKVSIYFKTLDKDNTLLQMPH